MDGAGVCVAWMILESRNRRSKALARRRRLARARRIFLHTSAVCGSIQPPFTNQVTMDEGKKFLLVGPCCKTYLLKSGLA